MRVEFIEARRVLLDALLALEQQASAVVLVGAQAVYLRTANRLPGYQAYTTDADLVIDPRNLSTFPGLGDLMVQAGFVLTAEPGIWNARFTRSSTSREIVVPVDLLVSTQVASSAGRRSARLGGGHGKATARKTDGLEGALVDHGPMLIGAFDDSDPRSVVSNVAGVAALVIAKARKLGERLASPSRLMSKDAGDLYRLFDVMDARLLAASMQRTLNVELSRRSAQAAVNFLGELYATPRSVGVRLTQDAVEGVVDPLTVSSFVVGYVRELRAELES